MELCFAFHAISLIPFLVTFAPRCPEELSVVFSSLALDCLGCQAKWDTGSL